MNQISKIYSIVANKLYGTGLTKNTLLRKLHYKIYTRLSPEFVNFYGFKIYAKRNHPILVFPDQENTHLINFIIKYVKNGQKIIDVGSNIGYVALMFSKKVGSDGIVYTFEPEKSNFQLLEKNIEKNNVKNVVPINKAVSNKTDKVLLHLATSSGADDSGGHSVIKNKSHTENTQLIDQTSLDDHFPKNTKIDWVKIDAEGLDLEVITGMTRLLEENPNIKLIVEYLPRVQGNNSETLVKKLVELGFKLYDSKKDMTQTDLSQLEKNYVPIAGKEQTDLICMKE